MNHIATVFSVLALFACSNHEAATPPAKTVEAASTTTHTGEPTIPVQYGAPLPDNSIYAGAKRDVRFAGGAARAAYVRTIEPSATTVRLVVAGPRGPIELRTDAGFSDTQYGLFAADDDVVAVEVMVDKHNGEQFVSAWRIVLQNSDVVVTQSFEASSPTSKLPLWIPQVVRQRAKEAAAAAESVEAENAAARREDEAAHHEDEGQTEEEAEEGAMTDAVETFEASNTAAPRAVRRK